MAENDYLEEYQDNIQDQEGPGKPKRPSPTLKTTSRLQQAANSLVAPPVTQPVTGVGSLGQGSNALLDIDAYEPYNPGGVFLDAPNDARRAATQGMGESSFRRIGNLIPNVAAGVVENAGYLGALLTEWGDNRDYNNALTELAQSMKNPLGEVYRENPNAVWDPADPAWWEDNFFGLVESVAQFAITGMGVGSLFGNLAKAAAIGSKTAIAGRVLGQGLTAATLAYTEGAMSGASVYEQTYETQMQRFMNSGLDYNQASAKANELASDAAATTVQLNTVLNTALNLTAVAPMFRSNDEILGWFRSSGQRTTGESLTDWGNRIRQAGTENPAVSRMLNGSIASTLSRYGGEAIQEGTEELVNQFAENTGREQGQQGKKLGFMQQLGELQNFFDETMDASGALNFVLGAIGGAGNTVVMENAPVHRLPNVGADGAIQRDAEGKPVMSWVSSRTRDAMGGKRYYENIVQAIEKDIDWYRDKTANLASAVEKGDDLEAERIKTQMFDAQNYWSIQNGLGESWANEMDVISNIDNKITMTEKLTPQLQDLMAQRAQATDPLEQDRLNQQIAAVNQEIAQSGMETDASLKGFSKGVGDDMYKERATEMKQDITKLNKLWTEVQARYNSPEEVQLGYGDFIFGREADVYRRQRILDRGQRNIQALEAEFNAKYGVGPGAPDIMFMGALTRFEAVRMAKADLDAQIAALEASTDPDFIDAGIERLGGSKNVVDREKALKGVLSQARDKSKRMEQNMQGLQTSLVDIPAFEDYITKNPDKPFMQSVEDYIKQQADMGIALADITRAKASMARFKSDTEMAEASLAYFKSLAGRSEYIQVMKRSQDDLAKERYNRAYESTMTHERLATEEKAAAEIKENMERQQYLYGIRRLHALQEKNMVLNMQIHTFSRKIAGLSARQNWKSKFRNWLAGDEAFAAEKAEYKSLITQRDYVRAQIQDERAGYKIVNPNSPVPAPVPTTAPDLTDTRIPTIVDLLDGAEHDIHTYLQTLQPGLREHLQNRLNTLLSDIVFNNTLSTIPGDYFAPEVKNNQLSPDKAATLLMLAQKELDALNELYNAEQSPMEDTDEALPPLEGDENPVEMSEAGILNQMNDDTAPESVPFSEKTNVPTESFMQTLQEEHTAHEGTKLRAVNSIANMALPYEEVIIDGNYMMINARTAVRDGYPELMLKPGSLTPKRKLIFQVDTEYNGTVSKPNQFPEWEPEGAIQVASKFDQYTDPKTGAIKDIDNVPIKILDAATGTLLGYVHTMQWINAQYPGASNYRNVVDRINTPDGFTDLMPEHRKEISRIRRIIVNNYNKGVPTEGAVEEVGPGQVVNTRTKKKGQLAWPMGSVKRRFPDTSLMMGIITKDIVSVGKGVTAADQELNVTIPTDAFTNVPGMLLPMYDGSHRFEPILMRNLNDTDINSVARAVELFFMKRAENPEADPEIQKILDTTGFNIATPRGVRQYINQYYTYSESFSIPDTQMNAELMKRNGTAKPFFMLDIRDNGDIKVGWKYGGARPIWAKLTYGELDPTFRAALVEGLATRPKNVTMQNSVTGLRGINSSGEFKEVFYNKAGKWTSKGHVNYNEYLKDKASTSAIGTNQLDDGSFVYAVNPSVQFSVQEVLNSPADGPVQNERTTEGTVEGQWWDDNTLSDTEKGDVLNLLGDFIVLPAPVNSVGINLDAQELSLEVLENLYTFTEPSQRNGKTPAQVYEEMVRAGIGQVAEGYNPFIKCGL